MSDQAKPTPTPEDVLQHLPQAFPEYFGDLAREGRLTADTPFEAAKIDSLGVVEVVLSVEERYEVQISDEEVSAIKTVRDLAEACARQRLP